MTPLQVVLDHVDDKTGTSLHHATKVRKEVSVCDLNCNSVFLVLGWLC